MTLHAGADSEWTLSLFGKPRVTGRGEFLDQFETKRAVYLLARLALSHRKALSRNEAAEWLWPGDYFDATRLRLRKELSRIRHGLGPARDILETDDDQVRLVDHDLEVDVRLFEHLFHSARREADPDKREQCYLTAVELSKEPFLEGLEETWIDAERARLTEIRYAMLVDLAKLQADRGDHEAALQTAKLAVEADPLQEAGHLVVMQELGKLGHLSDALGQYQQLRRLLRDELCESPSAEAERVVGDLRQSLPPLVEPRSVTTGLTFLVPSPMEPIYGRQELCDHLCRLLSPEDPTHRLVSLTGPGGIGKTRLANQVAVDLKPQFEGRVAWISMADISDPAIMPIVIATALGLTLGPSSDPMERICALLPDEPMLLVLDNLEQLMPDGLTHIRALAEARPNLRLLLTSRTALNFGGERAIAVGPLPIPREEDSLHQPALRIFLDPLMAEQGYREPDRKELAALRDIAERLEGIPLALQLASGRLRTLNPSELLKQLDTRLDIVNRRADAPERHRTIRAAIAGSYNAIDPELQAAMGRLCVFRGGWTLSAATFVCEAEDALPLLEQLMDCSLVRVDREEGGLRFRMLETIRDYVRETISPEMLREAQRRHADWLLEIRPKGDRRYMGRSVLEYMMSTLDVELDNFREACRYCLANDIERAVQLGSHYGRFWMFRSLTLAQEALSFYTELFEHQAEFEMTTEWAIASFWQGALLYKLGRFGEGDCGPEVVSRTLRLCEAAGLEVEAALAKFHGSRAKFIASDFEGALAITRATQQELRDLKAYGDLSVTLQVGAVMLYYLGRVDEAIAAIEESLLNLGDDVEPFHEVQTSMIFGHILVETGHTERAKEHAYRGLELAEFYRYSYFLPMIQEVCARIAIAEGNLELAAQWFRVSASGWEIFGSAYQYADQLHQLGRIHVRMGKIHEALEYVSTAAKIWERKGLMAVVPCTLNTAAKIYTQLGNPELGARCLATVLGLPGETRDSKLASEIAYQEEVLMDLREALGEDRLAALLSQAPDLETTLREAFA